MRIAKVLIFGLLLVVGGCSDDDNPIESKTTNPDGRLYVLNQGDNTMYVYDTKTMTRVDSVATMVNKPHYIEFSPNGQNFYIVTLETTGRIAKFTTADLQFVDSVTVPPAVQPSAIAITSNPQYGYVCNFSSGDLPTRIYKFDLETMDTVLSVQAGAITHDIKITSDGSTVIASNRNSDNLTLVFTDADTVAFVSIDPDSVRPAGSQVHGPFGVVIDHNDSLAYIACRLSEQVRVLDIAAQKIVDSIDIPTNSSGENNGPTLLAISPDNKTVFTTTGIGNSVVAFSTVTMKVLADIPLTTPFPFGITMSGDGSRVYVACINKPTELGRVFIIDGNSLELLGSIEVGHQSYGLIWQPVNP